MKKLGKGLLTLGQLNTLIHESKTTHLSIQLSNLLKWIKDKYFVDKLLGTPYPNPGATMPRGLKNFIKCIGSESPVCHYLPPTNDNLTLLDDMFNGIRSKAYKMQSLQKNLIIFFDLVVDVDDGTGNLPLEFNAMVLHLKNVAGKPFQSHVREVLSSTETSSLCR